MNRRIEYCEEFSPLYTKGYPALAHVLSVYKTLPHNTMASSTKPRFDEPLFESPQKRRHGIMSLLPLPKKQKKEASPGVLFEEASDKIRSSALRRGIIRLDPDTGKVAPIKSSPGRSRLHYDYLDRLARRRAFLKANPGIEAVDDGAIDISDDDMEVAEKIIQDSRSPSGSPYSPRRLPSFYPEVENDAAYFSPVKGNHFDSTPVPSPDEKQKILEKYGHSTMLADASLALFLDGPEGYFEQHKYKGKTSGNTMSGQPTLDHKEQAALFKTTNALFYEEKKELRAYYYNMFTQLYFELTQGFSLCFYGLGLKRELLVTFAEDFLQNIVPVPVVFVNGYNPSTTAREISDQLVGILASQEGKKRKTVFPKKPFEATSLLKKYKEAENSTKIECIVVVHSIDGMALRADKIQKMLAEIASIKNIHFIASVDNINAPLLWDSSKLSLFKFAWHDFTTYDSYVVEAGFEDLLLVGKSKKKVGSKGISFVLSSLTQNARKLYTTLVSEQLEALENETLGMNASSKAKVVGSVKNGIEFKRLYSICLEDFIASNEVSFRIMLREFIEHDMAGLSKNSMGTEVVYVPMNITELEQLL